MWVQSLGREDPLMKDKATLSSTQSERSTPLLVSSNQPSWQSGHNPTPFPQTPAAVREQRMPHMVIQGQAWL